MYDDGDEETLNLVKEKWKVIEADSDADKVGLCLVLFNTKFSLSKLMATISMDRRNEVITQILMLPLICMYCILLMSFFIVTSFVVLSDIFHACFYGVCMYCDVSLWQKFCVSVLGLVGVLVLLSLLLTDLLYLGCDVDCQ